MFYPLPGHPQHVIQRGNNRCPIFVADEDYVRFREELTRKTRVCVPTPLPVHNGKLPPRFRSRQMRTWIIGLTVALLAGCATFGEKSREMKFNDTVRLYSKTIEWSGFDRLGNFVKFTAENPPPDPQRYQDIKVSHYQPGQAQGTPDGKTVMRRAQIRYIESSRMSERSLTVQEVWTYSDEDGRWFLQSGWPIF